MATKKCKRISSLYGLPAMKMSTYNRLYRPKKGVTQHCSLCGKTGHNIRRHSSNMPYYR